MDHFSKDCKYTSKPFINLFSTATVHTRTGQFKLPTKFSTAHKVGVGMKLGVCHFSRLIMPHCGQSLVQ